MKSDEEDQGAMMMPRDEEEALGGYDGMHDY
jgi:hypothetical protein